jgi:DNA-binding winged helix-turn-helix (wHTH) protein
MCDHPSRAGASARVVRFAPFVFDRGKHQLSKDGQPVHLSPKAYDLLDVLLASGSQAVSKSDLHSRLWPDTFVSEANLASLVAEVRGALGDHGRDGRYIRTVHAFGYAFAREAVVLPGATGPTSVGSSQWLVYGERQLPLAEGEHIVGRDAAADLVLDSLSVSRRHARISVAGAQVTLEDLASKNGTWRKGRRVEVPVGLEDGDQLRFGSIDVVFRTLLEPGATRTEGE